MNFLSLVLCFIINIIICFGIPVGYFIYLIIAKKGRIKSYFCGVLVFLVSQIFLRIPLIQNILPKMDWYITMSVLNPVLYCLFLGITAGLFEEIGRFLGFNFGLKKNRSWGDGVAFGIGHGGIEAMLMAGVANIQNLMAAVDLSSGNYNAARYGMNEESLKAMFEALTGMDILYSGIERLSAISIHVGLTLLVLYGINKGKKVYLGLAILIHGFIDFVAAISVQAGVPVFLIELWCAIFALILLVFSIKSKKVIKGEVVKSEKI